jgi:hypothetical protein
MAIFTVSGGIPPGNYTGTFAGFEAQPANKEKGYPAGIRWRFVIDAGPLAGQSVSRITTSSPTPRNACGKVLSGLIGHDLQQGEQIDPGIYLGNRYLLEVAPGKEGGTRVESIVPMPSA